MQPEVGRELGQPSLPREMSVVTVMGLIPLRLLKWQRRMCARRDANRSCSSCVATLVCVKSTVPTGVCMICTAVRVATLVFVTSAVPTGVFMIGTGYCVATLVFVTSAVPTGVFMICTAPV